MPRAALVGSRIRERRSLLGLRQADVARAAGISAAYLNLIEHNRRRVGPELLGALALALATEPSALSEGERAAVLDALRLAAAAGEAPGAAEIDRAEDFAGRFPGWAELVAAQGRRILRLERTVTALSDRITYDPFLPAALHEILSAITSIRSTAAILAGGGVEPGWQDRFHANLHKDSERLAQAAEALVAYLDTGPEAEGALVSPQEEAEQWLEAQGALPGDPEAIASPAAREIALRHLRRQAEDAAALPEALVREAWRNSQDPLRLAAALDEDLPRVLRRLAGLLGPEAGLVCCDASGTLTFRRALDGFPLPRFGAPCALWPVFRALGHPGRPVRALVEMAGRRPQRFTVWAICRVDWPAGLDGPELAEATMLILPAPSPQGPAEPVGTSCRICPRTPCPARREPSILMDGG